MWKHRYIILKLSAPLALRGDSSIPVCFCFFLIELNWFKWTSVDLKQSFMNVSPETDALRGHADRSVRLSGCKTVSLWTCPRSVLQPFSRLRLEPTAAQHLTLKHHSHSAGNRTDPFEIPPARFNPGDGGKLAVNWSGELISCGVRWVQKHDVHLFGEKLAQSGGKSHVRRELLLPEVTCGSTYLHTNLYTVKAGR